jgi:hypothetical protein
MSRLGRFAKKLCEDICLPRKVLLVIILVTIVIALVGILLLHSVGWLILSLMGEPVTKAAAVETGADVLLFLAGVGMLVSYLYRTWKETK